MFDCILTIFPIYVGQIGQGEWKSDEKSHPQTEPFMFPVNEASFSYELINQYLVLMKENL